MAVRIYYTSFALTFVNFSSKMICRITSLNNMIIDFGKRNLNFFSKSPVSSIAFLLTPTSSKVAFSN